MCPIKICIKIAMGKGNICFPICPDFKKLRPDLIIRNWVSIYILIMILNKNIHVYTLIFDISHSETFFLKMRGRSKKVKQYYVYGKGVFDKQKMYCVASLETATL